MFRPVNLEEKCDLKPRQGESKSQSLLRRRYHLPGGNKNQAWRVRLNFSQDIKRI